ncbi:MAG: hypothetical protein AB1601_01325 [Planctomycetota bacterium]
MNTGKRYQFEPGFAVVRVDFDAWPARPPTGTTPEALEEAIIMALNPIRVYWSREGALAEARRLSVLNADKGVAYFATYTRVQVREAGEPEPGPVT